MAAGDTAASVVDKVAASADTMATVMAVVITGAVITAVGTGAVVITAVVGTGAVVITAVVGTGAVITAVGTGAVIIADHDTKRQPRVAASLIV